MRTFRSLTILLVAFALMGCASTTPGWTYAPASASASAAASGGASGAPGGSGAPSAPASAAPSGSAGPGGSAAPSAPASGSAAPGGSPAPSGSAATGGTVLELAAQNIAYDQTTLTAPADQPFQIMFANNDASVPHNVAIHEGSPTGPEIWKGEVFPGVATKTYDVAALKAGTYGFVCTVHPNMTGTLTVS